MSAMAASEAAAAKEQGGPQGPVDATWLILQRLDGLRRAQDKIESRVESLDGKIDALNGRMYLLLVPLVIAILGLLAKLLIPGA